MPAKKIVVAPALMLTAGIAQAGVVDVLPESATVTLVFALLAIVGLLIARKKPEPVDG